MGDRTRELRVAVQESVDAFNRGDMTSYAGHYSEDARLLGPFFPEPLVGRAAIADTAMAMNTAFPNMYWTIVSLLVDGDRVACELHIEGTQTGPLPTAGGEIPATDRSVSFDIAEVLEFGEDGLVTEHREYMDPGALMAQLGLPLVDS